MTQRITEKDLEKHLDRLNEGKPEKPRFTPGRYDLDYAYGGVKLVQYVNERGGQRDISTGGFGTKRELFTFMQGMKNKECFKAEARKLQSLLDDPDSTDDDRTDASRALVTRILGGI